VIFPLSNPTSRSEAVPQDLIEWTEGRALIGTGSPFPHPTWNGKPVATAQTNNAYIFPGVGLGVIASDAVRVTDAMFMAAAKTLAGLSPAKHGESRLLPPVNGLRAVARAIAVAVAQQAQSDGVAQPLTEEELSARIDRHIWEPVYRPYRKAAAKKKP
jgi:malate dehydrogenase (oxaloacetate-decarboxylating)